MISFPFILKEIINEARAHRWLQQRFEGFISTFIEGFVQLIRVMAM